MKAAQIKQTRQTVGVKHLKRSLNLKLGVTIGVVLFLVQHCGAAAGAQYGTYEVTLEDGPEGAFETWVVIPLQLAAMLKRYLRKRKVLYNGKPRLVRCKTGSVHDLLGSDEDIDVNDDKTITILNKGGTTKEITFSEYYSKHNEVKTDSPVTWPLVCDLPLLNELAQGLAEMDDLDEVSLRLDMWNPHKTIVDQLRIMQRKAKALVLKHKKREESARRKRIQKLASATQNYSPSKRKKSRITRNNSAVHRFKCRYKKLKQWLKDLPNNKIKALQEKLRVGILAHFTGKRRRRRLASSSLAERLDRAQRRGGC